MKLMLLTVVVLISQSLHANSSLSSTKIERAIDHATYDEVREIHQKALDYIVEAEQKEEFEPFSTFILPLNPKIYFVKLLFLGGYAVSSGDDLCIFGGWLSKKGSSGKCRKPWQMRNIPSFNQAHRAHVYSREYNCGGDNFRCNPMMFGSDSSGNGKCVPYNPVRNLSARCVEASKDLIEGHINSIKDDEILRNKFAHYIEHLIEECKRPGSSTCNALKGHLDKLAAKAKETNDVNLCRILVEPVASLENIVQVGSNINTPPVANQSDDDEAVDFSLENAEEKEAEMFENYKKMGGDPKAFAHVMCFFKKHQQSQFNAGHGGKVQIKEKCKIMINDYNKTSDHKRLFIMNRCTGKVTAMQSSHGRGGGNGVGANTGHKLNHLSNKYDTNASPSGFFIMGGWHHTSKAWKPGIKMHGLQKGINDNSYGRGVVFHRSKTSSAVYCGGGVATSDQSSPVLKGSNCGRTHGCIGIPLAGWDIAIRDILGERNGGPLLYTYSKHEAAKPTSYCGDNLWQ